MLYILQKEDNTLDLEIAMLVDILKTQRYSHEYIFKTLEELKELEITQKYKDAIPVGTIDFVTAWLNRFHRVAHISPIEVPSVLRTDEFLKREYKIVKAEDIPRTGRYFIKDVSELKKFSYTGNMEFLMTENVFDKPKSKYDSSFHLDKTHLYQVSEEVKILSEYRVYIFNGQIEAISNYDGDPCIFPDANLIKKANMIYSYQPDYPKSLSMDVMVTLRGTAIIEIHPFISCGLYNSLWGNSLAYAYRDGIDWVLKYNTPLTI